MERPLSRPDAAFAALAAFLVGALLATSLDATAESDPFSARVRAVTSVPYPAFQGADCTTLNAPRALVWRLLVSPERAATWLLAGVPSSGPRSARYGKQPTATKGDSLTLEVDTENGPRQIELKVVAEIFGEALAFLVTKDDADIVDKGITQLIFTFVLDPRTDGTTDLYWAWHYDSDSPFSAVLFSMGAQKRAQKRREAGLLSFKALVESAAALKELPLHDVAAPQPPARRK
jgi:hypothetical protein